METAALHAPNLTDRLAEALRMVDESIADARLRLAGQPDNPALQRLSEHAFTIPLSELVTRHAENGAPVSRSSWSVFDHDWLAQYEYARELLASRHFGALQELLNCGGYRSSAHGFRAFAPQVVENIRRTTGDLRSAASLIDMRGMSKAATMPSQRTAEVTNPGQLLEAKPAARRRASP